MVAVLATVSALAAVPAATAATNDVTGVVYQPGTTTPVAGVTVSAMDANGNPAGSAVVTSTDGTFGLSLTNGATYTIEVSPPNPDPNHWVTNMVAVTVPAAGSASPVSVSLLAATVTGTVTDSNNNNVPGAVLSAQSVSAPTTGASAAGTVAVSDQNGSYGLALPAGSYTLTVIPPQPNTADLVQENVALSVGQTGSQLQNVTIPVANVIGTVVDPSGTPVAETSVQAMSTTSQTAAPVAVGTDTSGKYLFHLDPGSYQISAQPPADDTSGWAPGTISVTVGASQLTGQTITLQTPALTGRVLTPDGSSIVKGAGVEAVSAPTAATPPTVATGQSATNGVYGLALPSGSYTVTAMAPPGSGYAASTTTVTIPAKNPTDLRLAVANVTGTVFAPDKTTPIPDANVLAVNSGGQMTQATAGTDGTYAFNLPAGTYEITATDPSGTNLYQQGRLNNVTVVAGGQPLTNQNVDLVAPDVTGAVTKPDGTTPASAAVYAYDTTARTWSAPSTTDATGRFGMALPNGTYRLVALANEGAQAQTISPPFTLTGGSPATIALTFPAPLPPTFDFTDITKAPDGTDADGPVSEASMSADSSKVVFTSTATNLGTGDTLANGQTGAFLYDTNSHAISFIGVASDAAISSSGRYLAFVSSDPNLPNNSVGSTGVWEEDLSTTNPTPVRVDNLTGGPSNVQPGTPPSVSDDGRFVTMTGFDGTGVTGYVADVTNGTAVALADPNGASTVADPQVSADGSTVDFVAFTPGAGSSPTYSLDSYQTTGGPVTSLAAMGTTQAVPPFAMSGTGATVAYAAYDANGAPQLHIRSGSNDAAAPLFDGFGAAPSAGISSVALDTAGDVFFTAASGEAGPSSAPDVWAYHPAPKTTTLVSADTSGEPVLLPVSLAGVSADGSHALLTAPADSFAAGATYTPNTNLFVGVPHQSTAPVWPQGSTLSATGVGASVATLAWSPISDPLLAGYRIFANGAQIAQVPASATSYVAAGLTPSTAYHFQVQAGGTDGLWTSDGPSADATTLASSQGASAVATVKLLATGAVQVAWPAAAGSPTYRVFRSVANAAPVALTPDTTSTSLTDHPPASSTVSYTVSTLDAGGNPSPYAVGDQAVTLPALFMRSVTWSGDTMTANGTTLLKSGSPVHIVAVGSPGYTVSAVVDYLQTPPATTAAPLVRRLRGGTPRVILRAPKDAAAQTATATVALTEDPANPGTYAADFPLPAGTTQLVSIAATLTDGGGGTKTAAAGQLPVPVAGSLAVDVQAPANSLTGGAVSIYGSTTAYSANQPISDGGKVTLNAPADTYFVSITNGQGSVVYWASGIAVAPGAATLVAAAPTFPAALAVNVVGSDTGQGLNGVWVSVLDASTQQLLASAPTGPDGTAQITGLQVPMGGTQVQLEVAPGQLAYGQPVTAPTTTVGIGQNSTQVTLSALPAATVKGVVTNPYGEPDPTATITASDTVSDGRYWSYSTKTDASGNYTLTVLAGHLNLYAGSPTGSSSSASVDVTGGQTLTQNVSMQGDVPYNLQVGIATKALGQSSYTPLPALDWREAVHFDFSVQTTKGSYGYGDLQNDENLDGVAAGVLPIYGHSGEVVKACADGSQAGLSPVQTCSTVTLGSDPNGSSVTVDINATPWVSASLATADGQPVTGNWTATLTDETATPPSVVSTISGSGRDLELPVSAPAGAYHLAIRAGSLVADQSVTVVDATKTQVGTVTMRSSNWFTPDSVPEDNTVTATPAQALPGDHVSFRAQFKNNGTDATSVIAALQKPAASTIETGSVTLNGQPVTPTQAADGSLTVPVGTLTTGMGGVIQYTVDLDPTAQPGSSLGAAVDMSFTAGGSAHTESLQSGAVQLAGVTITAPGVVNQLAMTVSGRAPANAPVTVYAGSTVMAATTSSPGGYWQAAITLPDLGGVRYYTLHAEAVYANTTLHSPDAGVYYNGTVPVVTKVTMWQDDPGNPNGRKFSYYPTNGVPSFPFVWVPGQVFHVQATFNHPDQVNNVTVQMGSGSTPQQGVPQSDGTFLATWTSPDPGDGQILVGFDALPQPLDLTHLTPQSITQTRSQLPDGLNDFSVPQPTVDAADPNTMDFNISLPSFAGGATDQAQLSLTSADYTPTQADLDQAKADGIPVYGRSVQFDPTTSSMTASGYIPVSALPTGVSAQLRTMSPRGIPAGLVKFAIKQGFLEGKTGAELGETALNKAATAAGAGLNIGPLGWMNMNYGQLNDMNSWIDNCTDPNERTSLRNQLLNLNNTMAVLDGLGTGVGVGFDIVAGATDTFGLLGGPETLGLSTLASWALTTAAGAAINAGFNALENANIAPVESAIRHCKGQKPEIANGGDDNGHHSGGGGSMTPMRDPSGFAYEGVESNRLAGVTTTLLQGPTANGPWTVWDATWFGQQNPLTTDGEGRYAWNVPDGWWKVQFTAPGYQTAFSQPEQVPPPRTGINVGLVSLSPPTLSSAAANADGTVTATFSQYMQTSTVTAADLSLLDSTGTPVAGSVTPVNPQNDPAGTSMARTFAFKPTAALPAGQLTMRATPPAFNYAGNPMAAAGTVNVAATPTGTTPAGGGAGSPTTGTWQAAGSTFSSSSSPPSRSNPVVIRVTTPVAGNVSAAPVATPTPPAGFSGLGEAEQITAPQASPDQPLVLSFDVDRSALPPGADDSELTVTRDGVVAGQCQGATTVTAVDPCISGVADHGSFVTITVLSTHASTWAEVAAQTDRLAGADRMGTAVAVSQAYFGPGQASAVVLARSDDYADGLTGGPLAAAKGGPLLLSDPDALPASVAAELTRVLAPGATVYLLGGTAALSTSVEQAVAQLGFKIVRLAGPDRYATAVAVAEALGNPSTVLLASGTNFPDALAAGAAAAHAGVAVLLSDGTAQAPATSTYLGRHSSDTVYAIGGPAAQAAPKATQVVGADRYATAVDVAKQFFPGATGAGLATGLGYADALSAGAVLGSHGEPLLLTDPNTLSSEAQSYIKSGILQLHVFGGTAAVTFDGGSYLGGAAVAAAATGAGRRSAKPL